jgi:AGZA family xanthine/uracil permease-like MFS transporter
VEPNESLFTNLPFVNRDFEGGERHTTLTTELSVGTATFLITMAYILAVNASILTDFGGPWSVFECVPLYSDSSVSISN